MLGCRYCIGQRFVPLRLVKLAFVTFFVSHWACCAFVFIGMAAEARGEESWYTNYRDMMQGYGAEDVNRYLASFYFIIMTLTTVG